MCGPIRLRIRAEQAGAFIDGRSGLSKQRFVVYVASKPPRSIFRSIAAHLNRRIIYIPIGALNPAA